MNSQTSAATRMRISPELQAARRFLLRHRMDAYQDNHAARVGNRVTPVETGYP